MNRDQIIADFAANYPKYQKIARKIAGENADDLIQTCAVMVLEMTEERLQAAWNEKLGLKPFFIRVLMNQYNSKTSRYHTNYRKQNKFIQDKGADILYNQTAHVEEEFVVFNDEKTDLEDITIDPIVAADAKIGPEIVFDPTIAQDAQVAREMVHVLQGQLFPHPVHNAIFDLYVNYGSLRKALQAVPDHLLEHIDLKLVHHVVREYRRIIRKHLNKKL